MDRSLYSWLTLALYLSTGIPVLGQVDVTDLPVLSAEDMDGIPPDFLVADIERKADLYRSADGRELILSNGLVKRTWRVEPNGACIGITCLSTGQQLLRSVRPEANVTIGGVSYDVGGLSGQPNHAYVTPEWLDSMEATPGAMRLVDFEVGEPNERFPWKRVRHHAPDVKWPLEGAYLRMDYELPAVLDVSAYSEIDPQGLSEVRDRMREMRRVRVSVHYEMYDGVPVMSKWITVHNAGRETVTVERFTSELLAVVERGSSVESREGVPLSKPDMLHVETDFAFGGFNHPQSNRHVVHWRTDPLYSTQVNYLRLTPCLLVVEPTYGPAQDVNPGESFESFRTFELIYDSSDRERRSLALRRMYRTIAPWITENPIMHHMRDSDPDAVRRAIDRSAEVGFEMIILSFGSGFNIESTDPDYIRQWTEIADYAEKKGIEIGGYSLLSSRRIGDGNDVVSPPGQRPTHGNCPALTSEWGRGYFQKLYDFFQETGFELLEHDGSYPGDVDVTSRPPFQKGIDDSRWAQWKTIADFYKWCRANGIYLNVPDYYYLSGSNKCGMGYREVNWSLPRPQQIIHTRQNIFDGTWSKTPSMGWMFVPLTQYHGGGAAATIEPLDEHRDHYERMMLSNWGLGVQACYRGPRLFDTDRTKALVKEWVAWFKAYRGILESDLIHGRRADGRDIDWMLHVNPALEEKGMLVVFNPLQREVSKTLPVDLYYTGLEKAAVMSHEDRSFESYTLARDYTVDLKVTVPANGMTWYVIREP